MRTADGRTGLLIAALALVIAACSSDGTLESTTSTTGPTVTSTAAVTSTTGAPTTTTSSTTTTTIASGDTVAEEGDKGEWVEATQWLLNCSGFGDLTLDGSFGPATLAAVEAGQAGLGFAVDGVVGETMFASLSRECSGRRGLDPGDGITVVGNAAPDDPEVYEVALAAGDTIAVDVAGGSGVTVTLRTAEGFEVEPAEEGGATWAIEAGGGHLLQVEAAEATFFELTVAVGDTVLAQGSWVLGTNGITYDGTKLAIGGDAETVIEKIFDFLGHGVRGGYAEFDTGWTEEPGGIGLRGIYIEGLAFLFYGPSTDFPAQPERLARIRFEGPSDDADGEPRPGNYVTTAKGITVGDTLAELKAAYGSSAKHGSNDDEHYYRITDSGGELCFYFGGSEPGDTSMITEIATECRD